MAKKPSTLDLGDSNQRLAEQIAELICSSSDPCHAAAQVVHSMIDHPWLDDELRDEMLTEAARSLDTRN